MQVCNSIFLGVVKKLLPEVIDIHLSNTRTRLSNNLFAFPTLSKFREVKPPLIGMCALTSSSDNSKVKKTSEGVMPKYNSTLLNKMTILKQNI